LLGKNWSIFVMSKSEADKVKDQSLGTMNKTIVVALLVGAIVSGFSYLLYSAFTHHRFGWFIVLVLLGIGASFAMLLLVVAYYFAGVAMRPPWYKPTSVAEGLTEEALPDYWQGIWHDPKTDLGLDFDEVEFESKPEKPLDEPLVLRGWLVPGSEDVPKRRVVVVAVHGGGRDRRAFLRHTAFFHAEGYPVLLFDFREHGTSDGNGRGFTYGVKEHLDVEAAVAFAKQSTGCPIACVLATSVGATATIVGAANDLNIDGVIAENPLTRPEELVTFFFWAGLDYALGRYARSTPCRWFGRMVVAVFLWRIGALKEDSLWPNHRGAVDVVHRIAPRPLLLMHGDEDKIIPPDHSLKIYKAAAEPKDLWIAKGAVHCALYDRRPEEYKRRVLKFLADLEEKLFQPKNMRSRSWESGLASFSSKR
jgi:pimeloyl-ACP methyl ester carboxylesterase